MTYILNRFSLVLIMCFFILGNSSGNESYQNGKSKKENLDAIHRASKRDMLKRFPVPFGGLARDIIAAFVFTKRNTPTGCVIQGRTRIGGYIATITFTANDGWVGVYGNYANSCVQAVHNSATNVKKGVEKNQKNKNRRWR